MAEKFTERTAGIWFPLAFYAIGGAYMLAFWAAFDRMAYHLAVLGVASIVIAVALYSVSRWAFWLGLFTFPLFFAEFLYSIMTSVNLLGWYPDAQTTAFHASLITYLVFLCASVLFLIDKRSTLKTDRFLDKLKRPVTTPETPSKPQ